MGSDGVGDDGDAVEPAVDGVAVAGATVGVAAEEPHAASARVVASVARRQHRDGAPRPDRNGAMDASFWLAGRTVI